MLQCRHKSDGREDWGNLNGPDISPEGGQPWPRVEANGLPSPKSGTLVNNCIAKRANWRYNRMTESEAIQSLRSSGLQNHHHASNSPCEWSTTLLYPRPPTANRRHTARTFMSTMTWWWAPQESHDREPKRCRKGHCWRRRRLCVCMQVHRV